MAEPLTPPIEIIEDQVTWRPVDNSGIVFDPTKLLNKPESLWECDGYREHLSDDEGWVVERSYECNWSDVANAMQWLRGYSRASLTGIARVTPAQDPYRPWLYCMRCELIEPQGVPLQDPDMPLAPATVWAEMAGMQHGLMGGGKFNDGKAKLRATFRGVPYVMRSDAQQSLSLQTEIARYVERVPRYAIQGIPLANVGTGKNGQLFFVGTKTLVPEAGVLLMPTASWIYRWHDVPFYPTKAIGACMGQVNSDSFDGVSGWPLFPPGTLLCQAPEIHMQRNAAGQAAFNIDWILDFRPQGWNFFPAADGQFKPATFGGGPPALDGSNLVFKPAKFSQLFQAGAPFFYT